MDIFKRERELKTTMNVMCTVGMGKGPKRRLELVNCGVQSRPSTQNRARRLYLDLDLTETCTRQIHFW